MEFASLIQTVLIYALPVLFAITVHEAAHGYAAHRLGDSTAYLLGRVTLNPLAHIDPIGTLLVPLLLYFSTGGEFLFGYAKPVPVQFNHLHHPKRDMVWVALAGPAANLLQAILWVALAYVLLGLGVQEPFFLALCKAGQMVNLVMFAFNLFPLPPLDGGRVLVGLLPPRPALWLARVEPWGFFVVLALVLTGVVNALWMHPVMSLSFALVRWLLSPLSGWMQ